MNFHDLNLIAKEKYGNNHECDGHGNHKWEINGWKQQSNPLVLIETSIGFVVYWLLKLGGNINDVVCYDRGDGSNLIMTITMSVDKIEEFKKITGLVVEPVKGRSFGHLD